MAGRMSRRGWCGTVRQRAFVVIGATVLACGLLFWWMHRAGRSAGPHRELENPSGIAPEGSPGRTEWRSSREFGVVPVNDWVVPTYRVIVKGCGVDSEDIHLYRTTGPQGWNGGDTAEWADRCTPDQSGACAFDDVSAGTWIIRQGMVVVRWEIFGTVAGVRKFTLPCGGECRRELVVDADLSCGDSGTFHVFPREWPDGDILDAELSSGVWRQGEEVPVERVGCQHYILEVRGAQCVARAVVTDTGGVYQKVHVVLKPRDAVRLRFLDAESSLPVAGVRVEDPDLILVRESDRSGVVEVGRRGSANLEARHAEYQTTGIALDRLVEDEADVYLLSRRWGQVICSKAGSPCPGRTLVCTSFLSGESEGEEAEAAGPTSHWAMGDCEWVGVGRWRCERGRLWSLRVILDGQTTDLQVPDGAESVFVELEEPEGNVCVDFEPPGGDCYLEGKIGRYLITPQSKVPVPEGAMEASYRVVCQDAQVWATVDLDRRGECFRLGPWQELGGICVNPSGTKGTEQRPDSTCMLVAGIGMQGGAEPTAVAASQVDQCPTWVPAGEYLLACDQDIAQPVQIVAGEVLEVVVAND